MAGRGLRSERVRGFGASGLEAQLQQVRDLRDGRVVEESGPAGKTASKRRYAGTGRTSSAGEVAAARESRRLARWRIDRTGDEMRDARCTLSEWCWQRWSGAEVRAGLGCKAMRSATNVLEVAGSGPDMRPGPSAAEEKGTLWRRAWIAAGGRSGNGNAHAEAAEGVIGNILGEKNGG